MPSRLLREGILDSEPVNSLSWPAEVFYRRLMSVVDDYGRFDGRPAVLRSRLYPLKIDTVREADISRWIAECVTAGLIALYAVESRPYLLFPKLGAIVRSKSKFPEPPAGGDVGPVRTDANTCSQLQTDVNGCSQLRAGSGSGSGTGSSAGTSEECPEAAKAPPSGPPVLTFPTKGTGAKEWHLTEGKLAEYREAFPGLDVMAECRKALQWIRDAPERRKTPGGMARFLGGWLGRARPAGGFNDGRRPAGPERSARVGLAPGTTVPTDDRNSVPRVLPPLAADAPDPFAWAGDDRGD